MAARTLRYTARVVGTVETQPGCWNKQRIGVFDGDTQIGEYVYGYSSGCPFYAFRQGDDWFALVSLDYTATRVMSLPDCRILGGEKGSAGGFCPVEFYVPAYYWHASPNRTPAGTQYPNGSHAPSHYVFKMYDDRDYEADTADQHWLYESIGFRSGCVWGDDSCWKLQTLDLTHAREGKLTVIEPNYIELADYPLRECITLHEDDGELYGMRLQTQRHLKLRVLSPDRE